MAMTGPDPITSRRTLAARHDERVFLYGLIAVAVTLAGVYDGGLRLILIGVPFMIALLVGGRNHAPAPVAVSVAVESDRCVEGDTIGCRIDVNVAAHYDVEIMVAPATDSIVPVDEQPWAWSIPIGVDRPVGLEMGMIAERWGRHVPGAIEIRLTQPGSLFERRAQLLELPPNTVLPAARRLDQLLRIDRAPASAGAHPTRSVHGGGYDFAEVRDYRPGDRLRDLNWSATLRRDELAVNHRLPERAGDIVIVVDTFPDALRRHSEVSRDVITRVGRLAWTVLNSHLSVNDRVGIVVEGSRPLWLSPQSGRRARYALFAALLDASASSADPVRNPSVRAHGQVPASATVLAISPLARPRTIDSLASMRGQGHRVQVIALDIAEDLRARAPKLPAEIVRVRDLVFAERVATLRRQGISVVVCTGDTDGIAAIRKLVRLPTRHLSRA
jgi:uncharacterized protein (DUF58 family)